MPDAWPMVEAMHRFLRASVGSGPQLRILSEHPELLNFGIEYIDGIAGDNLAVCYPDLTRSDARAKLKAQRALLVRCEQVGIARAFSEAGAQQGGRPRIPDAPPRPPPDTYGARKKRRRRVALIGSISVLAAIGAGIGTFLLLHHTAVPGAAAQPIAVSGDGKTIASAGARIRLWDVATRKVDATLTGPRFQYTDDLAFSPDGKTLVIENNSDLYLWNVASRRVVATLTSPTGLSSPAFSPDGAMLAAAGADNKVYLWDASGLRLITTFQTLPRKVGYNGLINTGQITGIAFGPDSKSLAVSFFGGTGSYENQPGGELWNIATRRIVTEFPSDDTGDGVAFSPDGKTVVIEDSGGYFLWDVAQKKLRFDLSDPSPDAGTWHPAGDAAVYDPDGKTLATADGSPNDSVFLWNVATGRMSGRLTDPNSQGIGALAYMQDGRTLAVSDGNGNIYLWDLATGHITATLTAPSSQQ
jgi:WD40 repeat protein